MKRSDLDFAERLRAEAGWNQTRADLELLLALSPAGCFVAQLGDALAGIITTTIYSPSLAWIGMLLVQETWRHRGVGSALFEQALRYLGSQSVCCLKLDATPAGEPIYSRRGFKPERLLTRWRAPSVPPLTSRPEFGPVRFPAAWAEVLDLAAFGASRREIWLSFSERGCCLGHEASGAIGCARPGALAWQLGPVIARSEAAAEALVGQLLRRGRPGPVFWDIPDAQKQTQRLAAGFGFQPERSWTRLFLGARAPLKDDWLFAIADPAFG